MRWLGVLILISCGEDAHRTAPLWSDGTHLRDDAGRIAVLRGVNARVEGVFDVTFSDGRVPLEPIPPLDDADCARMHELGLDFLRLPINWSAIEPERDRYDEAYLARVDAAVRCADRAGLFVMIDLHQDAYSKEIGEDGAPLWAIQPPPELLLEGPLDDLGDRRLSGQVTRAFTSFFAAGDPSGMQAEFGDMIEHVAARWATDPAVIGFEIYNEPIAIEANVVAFSAAMAARVRAIAPDKLVMFEPSATRNLFDYVAPSSEPFPVASAVYAPHIYTFVFASNPASLEQLAPGDLDSSVEAARDEADAWHTPLVIGEFGIGPTQPNANLWMGVQAALHDRLLASDAFWVWKEDSQGSWGLFERDTGGAWIERPQVRDWISRVHAARIAGRVVSNAYDFASGSLVLEARDTGGIAHVIYAPSLTSASCNGEAIALSTPGFVDVACDGVLHITPMR